MVIQKRLFTIILLNSITIAQDNRIILNQGAIIGLKIFPETSKIPVYAFLGIPYAQPPIGDLRFSPPKPHNGWNKTYYAKSFKPICPQLTNTIYDETSDRILRQMTQMDEDCLYINIWSPENGLRYGNLPILVIITGEEMSFDWPQNHPSGLDLASEGCIVVTIQYRMNVFGWLTTLTTTTTTTTTATTKQKPLYKNRNLNNNKNYDNELIGNYGLHDQKLALKWIQDNIHKFGGNKNKITLLGHGNSGSILSLIHLLNSNSNSNNNDNLQFSKLILMSGNMKFLNDIEMIEPNDDQFSTSSSLSLSKKIINKLGCQFHQIQQISNCLRSKSVNDLLNAFNTIIYKNGNYSKILGPILDINFLPLNQRYFHINPLNILITGTYNKNIPIIIGICTNEGAFIRNYWIDLAREGLNSIKMYINYTIIPLILKKYSFINEHKNENNLQLSQIYKTIFWRYFEQDIKNPLYLLGSLQRLISEADYESRFYDLIELIARPRLQQFYYANNQQNDSIKQQQQQQQQNNNFYVYVFHLTNSMDMRGKINLYGGASHSSDLPLLMGPSLFQQISRRRLTLNENKLCKRLRQYFIDFIKTGNPTPDRPYDGWLSYTTDRKFIKILGDNPNFLNGNTMLQFEQNLPAIEEMLQKNAGSDTNINEHLNPYYIGNKEGSLLEQSRRHSKSLHYINRQDYEYFQYLKIVHSFWNVLLPSIYKSTNEFKMKTKNNSLLTERAGREILYYESDSTKYKKAFFSMLGLVCFLLGILGICLYMLRKKYPNFGRNL